MSLKAGVSKIRFALQAICAALISVLVTLDGGSPFMLDKTESAMTRRLTALAPSLQILLDFE